MESFVRTTKSKLLTCAILLAGCGGPDHDAICGKSEDCINGNEKDVAACVADYDYEAAVASDLGCTSEYDDYYQCFQDTATCTAVSPGSNNKTYQIKDPHDCEAERNAYRHCNGIADVKGGGQ